METERGDLPSSGKCRDVKMQEDKWDWFMSLQVIPADERVREWPAEKRPESMRRQGLGKG